MGNVSAFAPSYQNLNLLLALFFVVVVVNN